ncbi:MAG: hypothetical protein ACFE8N_10930 [Promethearchaeota archaeon]
MEIVYRFLHFTYIYINEKIKWSALISPGYENIGEALTAYRKEVFGYDDDDDKFVAFLVRFDVIHDQKRMVINFLDIRGKTEYFLKVALDIYRRKEKLMLLRDVNFYHTTVDGLHMGDYLWFMELKKPEFENIYSY